jgi:hypothetical protein
MAAAIAMYEKARATLKRSNQLSGDRQPAELAFLAMTQHRLSQAEAAYIGPVLAKLS